MKLFFFFEEFLKNLKTPEENLKILEIGIASQKNGLRLKLCNKKKCGTELMG